MATLIEETVTEGTLFDPNFLNLEFVFNFILWFSQKIYHFFTSFGVGEPLTVQEIPFVKNIAWIASLIFVWVILYSLWHIRKIRKNEEETFGEAHVAAADAEAVGERNKQWERVLDLAESHNESDWKLAIMEADTMLGIILTKMGYSGETIGEQLKGVEVSDFTTISQAWAAHKVRNQIAHEGMNLVITQRKAKETIDLFRQVFEEFHFI